MDIRAKIIDSVLESLPGLSTEVKEQIEHALLVQLQDYEVQEGSKQMVRVEKHYSAINAFAEFTYTIPIVWQRMFCLFRFQKAP